MASLTSAGPIEGGVAGRYERYGTLTVAAGLLLYALRRRSDARILARNCSGVSGNGSTGGAGAELSAAQALAWLRALRPPQLFSASLFPRRVWASPAASPRQALERSRLPLVPGRASGSSNQTMRGRYAMKQQHQRDSDIDDTDPEYLAAEQRLEDMLRRSIANMTICLSGGAMR
jgi:hypothetical protein